MTVLTWFLRASRAFMAASYLNLPKSMRTAAGGLAIGATSTRSRSASAASRSASSTRTMPTCSPLGPTNRTSGTRMRSLMRGSLMVVLLQSQGARSAEKRLPPQLREKPHQNPSRVRRLCVCRAGHCVATAAYALRTWGTRRPGRSQRVEAWCRFSCTPPVSSGHPAGMDGRSICKATSVSTESPNPDAGASPASAATPRARRPRPRPATSRRPGGRGHHHGRHPHDERGRGSAASPRATTPRTTSTSTRPGA